jgi:hypothetical protein
LTRHAETREDLRTMKLSMKTFSGFVGVLGLIAFAGCSSSNNDSNCSIFDNGYQYPSDSQASCTEWGNKFGCSTAELLTGDACGADADQCCVATGCSSSPTCP